MPALPVDDDVLDQIFAFLSDFQSLGACLLTCKAFYQVYMRHQQSITRSVATNLIGPVQSHSNHAVAELLGVSVDSIQWWQTNLNTHGLVNPPQFHPGRPRILSTDVSVTLTEYVSRYPDEYLDELVEWLAIYHNTLISRSALHDNLKNLNLTWKRMKHIATGRDDGERITWYQNFLRMYTPEQLVFLDESSKDGHTLVRRYGWAPSGVTPQTITPLDRGDRYSILPAMDMNGYFAVQVKKGSFDSADFLDFVMMDVLPEMNPYPGPWSVLVMDNCSTHQGDFLKNIVEATNCHLVFLPPYSPDYNPIEESFSCVKAWLRRNYRDFQHSNFPELQQEMACYEAVTAEKAQGWFRDSGYM